MTFTLRKDPAKLTAFPVGNAVDADHSKGIDTRQKVNIRNPVRHDVLLGRGGGTNNHIGNIDFRKVVNSHKIKYLACSKVDKPKVAREVVKLWRQMDPPGRFLAKQESTKGPTGEEKNLWHEVGDKKAREKASQCLRERTPDVLPFVKSLKEVKSKMAQQQKGGGSAKPEMQFQGPVNGNPSFHQGSLPMFGAGQRESNMGKLSVGVGNQMPMTASSSPQGVMGGPASMMLSNPNFNIQTLFGLQQQGMNFQQGMNLSMLNMNACQAQQPLQMQNVGGQMMNGQNVGMQWNMSSMNNLNVSNAQIMQSQNMQVCAQQGMSKMQQLPQRLDVNPLVQTQTRTGPTMVSPVASNGSSKKTDFELHAGLSGLSTEFSLDPLPAIHQARGIVPERNARTQGHLRSSGKCCPPKPVMQTPKELDVFASNEEPDDMSLGDYKKQLEAFTKKRKHNAEPEEQESPRKAPSLFDDATESEDVTLEEYKKTLEAYIANHQSGDRAGLTSSDDDDDLSDSNSLMSPRMPLKLPDEKVTLDLDMPFMKSYTSKGTTSSFMSGLFSDTTHISGLSLLETMSMEEKIEDPDRDAASNISVLSELTDISQHIENLKMADD